VVVGQWRAIKDRRSGRPVAYSSQRPVQMMSQSMRSSGSCSRSRFLPFFLPVREVAGVT